MRVCAEKRLSVIITDMARHPVERVERKEMQQRGERGGVRKDYLGGGGGRFARN